MSKISDFHAKDGWYFRRLNGGAVRVVKDANPATDNTPLEATFTADEWASIVASVSHTGETYESFTDAKFVHQGSRGDRSPILVPPSSLPAESR